MEILFTGDAVFVSGGITFSEKIKYNVSAELGEYLLKTFGTLFSAVEVAKPAPKTRKKSTNTK